jgi:SseB protein C-terminal domain/SseB protein N-terminal domain
MRGFVSDSEKGMTPCVNAMEDALAAAHAGSLSSDALLETLAVGQVWVPLPTGAHGGAEANLPIMWIDNLRYVPVYTSEDQFRRESGDMAHMVSPLRDFARVLPAGLGIAVNPGGQIGLPINPPGVDIIRGGQRTAPAGSRLRLGQPEVEPVALVRALTRVFGLIKEIRSARSGWGQFGDDPPGLILGIELNPDSEALRGNALAAVAEARAQVPDPCNVDSVFLNEPGDTVADWLIANTAPFYERKTRVS